MERPKFAKAAEKNTAASRLLHSAAAGRQLRGAVRGGVEGADGRGRGGRPEGVRGHVPAQAAARARSGQLGAGRARRRAGDDWRSPVTGASSSGSSSSSSSSGRRTGPMAAAHGGSSSEER